MCGIAAVFNCENPVPFVESSLRKIAHRGGNILEYETFDNAALGANRLPIVGRATGKQPLTNEDRTIFAVQNGEIFNHKELRKNLEAKGHVFLTDCDTEILAHAFEEYGKDVVKHLDSEMFAFIIYNDKTKDVYAARDPLGVKPFYYATTEEGAWHFASELKQLVQFQNLTDIHEFPAGHYFFKGKFKRYFTLKLPQKTLPEAAALRQLEREITLAVKKRVDTDLPIGVFLSGGVDSSLVMEIATRFHPDVTAIILGTPDSPDYRYALRICEERGYKYHVIRPQIDYAEELDELLYHLETYEPLIVRQAFANWICSREAQRLGLSVVLVGEGADELFAGYNEFSALPADIINEGCKMLTQHLGQGHLKRVDRAAMRFTVEVRAPFLDANVVKTAMSINGKHKIHRCQHRVTTKYILRKVAAKFLPDYIAYRYKVPFANGAGMNVGYSYESQGGDIAKLFIKDKNAADRTEAIDRFDIKTPEERYYVQKYLDFGFQKLAGSENRAIVKDNLYKLNPSKTHRFVVAEFDKLALYFPLYLAAVTKKFKIRNLDVEFISTGTDDSTYASLCNNSAQIGLADPLFAMFDNLANREEKGEIIGQMVGSAPVVAVAINPAIAIESMADFSRYKVGTFPKFTTTHTILSSTIGKDIETFEHSRVVEALENRRIDIAVVLAEQALDLQARGGRIVFNFAEAFPHYFFSGFTISGQLDHRHRKHLPAFISAVREAMSWMKHHKPRALNIFRELFPEIHDPEAVIQFYEKMWVSNLKVNHDHYLKSHEVWRKMYPDVLKSHTPFFRSPSSSDPILEIITNRKFRREYPFLEDALRQKIERAVPIHMVGFWGASDKEKVDKHDVTTIDHFSKMLDRLNKAYKPQFSASFILADMHADNNGYAASSYMPYLRDIEELLARHDLKSVYLSSLWKKWNMSPESVMKNLRNRPPHWWSKISINKNLEEKSANNFNGNEKIFGAQKYYAMRDVEKPLLEKEYEDHVFFVYGDSMPQQIYPHLPTLYLWSERPSFSPCPWFMIEGQTK